MAARGGKHKKLLGDHRRVENPRAVACVSAARSASKAFSSMQQWALMINEHIRFLPVSARLRKLLYRTSRRSFADPPGEANDRTAFCPAACIHVEDSGNRLAQSVCAAVLPLALGDRFLGNSASQSPLEEGWRCSTAQSAIPFASPSHAHTIGPCVETAATLRATSRLRRADFIGDSPARPGLQIAV
jgi:hypothetical protein